MSQAPVLQQSAYLAALSQEIERKLQQALNSRSQRRQLLQQLFADIALEIDDRARDLILIRDEDGVASANDEYQTILCFYEIIADHYIKFPDSGKHILDLIVQLWSQSFVHIYLLFFSTNGCLKFLWKILKSDYVMDLP